MCAFHIFQTDIRAFGKTFTRYGNSCICWCFIVEMLVEKDRLISKAIEEKQNLVAQILNVPIQDFQHVAEVNH